MERSILEYIQMCEWDPARFLILSDNVFDPLIYYSHLVPLIVSLAIGFLVFLKSPKSLAARWLSVAIFLITLWLFFDLILWATEKPIYTMFFWSVINLIEPMIYAGMLFFVYAFVDGKSISFKHQAIVFGLLLPTTLLAFTSWNLSYYDLTNCWREAVEGPLIYYNYIIEATLVLWIIVFGMNRFQERSNAYEKRKIILIISSSAFFLFSLSIGNIVGSIQVEWDNAGQYGLFGIPIFTAALAYLIVKYHAFNIKLLAAQMLIVALGFLTASLLFLEDIGLIRLVIYITLIFFSVLGYLLIRSVKREVEQRERIERLAEELQETNKRQEVLFHFIGHEVKGFLTKDANAFAALADGDFGALPEPLKPLVGQALMQARNGERSVTDILTASNLKKGTVAYTKEPLDLKMLTAEAIEKARAVAQQKGLALSFVADESSYQIVGDRGQIVDHVLRNLIDNAINYTLSGSVAVSLKKENGKIIFAVKDSGVGITEEDKKRLFTEGGHGKDSQKVNAHSTGYGLYIAKNIILAHGGTIRAESEGAGKGSTFIIEFSAV